MAEKKKEKKEKSKPIKKPIATTKEGDKPPPIGKT